MKKLFFLIFISMISGFSLFARQIILKNGMTIKKSAVIDSSHYKFNAKKNKPVLTIQGNNIILDFKGATLQGSNDKILPDQFYGTAIQIKKGKNITIKNLRVLGYRTAFDAKNIEGLRIENCEFNNNYRRNIEDLRTVYQIQSDLSYHSNLASSVLLKGCKKWEIINCRAKSNENVVSLWNCSDGILANNDFSFNSGASLVLTSSANNQVLYNRLNFNVADTNFAFSGSVVMDGNSSSNIIYKNSITHSVNGIMAGSYVSGKNAKSDGRSIIMENDLSYSFNNGVYSINTDVVINKNRIYHSGTGTRIVSPANQFISNNQFRYNRAAIDISGTGNAFIHHNIFFEDQTAVKIFFDDADNVEKLRSRKATLVANSFNRNNVVFHLGRVDSIAEFNNLYQQSDTLFKPASAQMNVNVEENEDLLVKLSEDLVPLISVIPSQNPFRGNGRFAGRNFLVQGKWGPYDFSYPLALVRDKDSTGSISILVLGPEGEWSVKEIGGYELISISWREVPAVLTVKKNINSQGVIKLEFKEAAGRVPTIGFSPVGLEE